MTQQTVSGCIIAGGLSRRMGGGQKCFLPLAGKTILERIISRLLPQVFELIVNADDAAFAGCGLRVIDDAVADRPGPLAGLLAALEESKSGLVVTVPSDTPFIPGDLVVRLAAEIEGRDCVVALSGGRRHPVCGLWRKELAGSLRRELEGGMRKVEAWTACLSCGSVSWPDIPYDPFFNINTPDDMIRAERIVMDFAL